MTPEEIALEDAAAPGGFGLIFAAKVHRLECEDLRMSVCGQDDCEYLTP